MRDLDLGEHIQSAFLHRELDDRLGTNDEVYFRAKTGLNARLTRLVINPEEIYAIFFNFPKNSQFADWDLAAIRVREGFLPIIHYMRFMFGTLTFVQIHDPELLKVGYISTLSGFFDKSERFVPTEGDWKTRYATQFQPSTLI